MNIRYFFSKSTLDILKRNQGIIQSHQQTAMHMTAHSKTQKKGGKQSQSNFPISSLGQEKGVMEVIDSPHDTKPYRTINQEYLRHNAHIVDSFLSTNNKDLRAMKNKLAFNEYLARTEDKEGNEDSYEGYPLQKIIHICLKELQSPQQCGKKWKRILKRVNTLFRNPSVQDNVYLLYISSEKGETQLQALVLAHLREEFVYLTDRQQQWLFFTICQVKNKSHIAALHGLKQKLMRNAMKSRVPLNSAISWALMGAVYHLNLDSFGSFLSKIIKHGSLNMVTPENLINFLVCSQLHNTPIATCTQMIGSGAEPNPSLNISHIKNILTLYKGAVPNYDTLQRSLPEHLNILIKMHEYLSFPSQQALLTNQQILIKLTPADALMCLHWLWRHGIKDSFEIQTLYEGINIDLSAEEDNLIKNVHNVYHMCWIELGLQIFQNYEEISQWAKNVDYIPRELEWPLWNYLYAHALRQMPEELSQKLTNSKFGQGELTFQQNQDQSEPMQSSAAFKAFLEVNSKIRRSEGNRNRVDLIKAEIELRKNMEAFKEFDKFIHEVQLWNFQPLGVLEPTSYLCHFIEHGLRVTIDCYLPTQSQETALKDANTGTTDQESNILAQTADIAQPADRSRQTNKHLLEKHFSYGVITINMLEFRQKNINQRILWLKKSIERASPLKPTHQKLSTHN